MPDGDMDVCGKRVDRIWSLCPLFFFNDTATTEIYTLSLHDALPICLQADVEMQASGSGQNLVEVRTQENLAAAEGQKQRPRACQIVQHLEALGGGQFSLVVMIQITVHAALVAAVGQVEMHAERPVLFDGTRD